MKVSLMTIVIGRLGTIPKEFVKGQEDLEMRGREKNPSRLQHYLDRSVRRLAVS